MSFKSPPRSNVNDYEGLRWVEEANAGFCVKNTSAVFSGAKRILADYEAYRLRAIGVFDERLNFDKAFLPIAEELETTIPSTIERRS